MALLFCWTRFQVDPADLTRKIVGKLPSSQFSRQIFKNKQTLPFQKIFVVNSFSPRIQSLNASKIDIVPEFEENSGNSKYAIPYLAKWRENSNCFPIDFTNSPIIQPPQTQICTSTNRHRGSKRMSNASSIFPIIDLTKPSNGFS